MRKNLLRAAAVLCWGLAAAYCAAWGWACSHPSAQPPACAVSVTPPPAGTGGPPLFSYSPPGCVR